MHMRILFRNYACECVLRIIIARKKYFCAHKTECVDNFAKKILRVQRTHFAFDRKSGDVAHSFSNKRSKRFNFFRCCAEISNKH